MSIPRRRSGRIITEEVEDELLVYDQDRDEVHRLNGTAALVWRQLDGQRMPSELVAIVAAEVGEDVADEDLVMVALDELHHAGLLEDHEERGLDERRMSRRRFLRRVGVVGAAALALPVVESIAAPTPAAAQSPCAMCKCIIG